MNETVLTRLPGLIFAGVVILAGLATAQIVPSPPELLPFAPFPFFSLPPSLATDGNGTWIAGSVESGDGGIASVVRSIDNGATWALPRQLTPDVSPIFYSSPLGAAGRDGRWNSVFIRADVSSVPIEEDLVVSRSDDAGDSWSPPAPISTSIGDAAIPSLATDGSGIWVTYWSADTGASVDSTFYSRSLDNGLTWTERSLVSIDAISEFYEARNPDIASDGLADWVAVLDVTTAEDTDIYVTRSSGNAETWTEPVLLNGDGVTDLGDDSRAQIATDGLGTWVTAWASTNPSFNLTDILYSRSVDNGITWTERTLLTIDTITGMYSAQNPTVASDRLGNWIIAWEADEVIDNVNIGNRGIFMAHSMDRCESWSAPTLLDAGKPEGISTDGDPTLASDQRGNWIAVWRGTDSNGLYVVLSSQFQAAPLVIRSLTGTITDAEGDRVACASIVASLNGTIHGVAVADDSGNYVFGALPVGDYSITVFAPGYSDRGQSTTLLPGLNGELDFVLADFDGVAIISGTVTDSRTGQPIGGVRVELVVDGEIVVTTYTCVSGRYGLRAPGKGSGPATVRYSAAAYEPIELEIDLSGGPIQRDQPLAKISLPGNVVGVVTNSGQNKTVVGAIVVATDGSVTHVAAPTGCDGVFTLPNMDARPYTFSISNLASETPVAIAVAPGEITPVNLDAVDGQVCVPMDPVKPVSCASGGPAQGSPWTAGVAADFLVIACAVAGLATIRSRERRAQQRPRDA